MKTLLKNCAIYGGETADILVEDGIIAGIGSFDSADEVHDMSGYASVLPGVIDAHMHIVTGPIEYNDRALKSWAQAGVTTVRDLGIGNDKNTYPTETFLAYRDTIENPECAHCQTCGRFVTEYHGYSHVMSDGAETGYGCQTAQDAVDAVNELIDMGCDGIKTAVDGGDAMFGAKPLITLDKLKAIVETAKARGVWCCAHVLAAKHIPLLLEAGMPEFCHMPTDRVPDEYIEQMVAQGVTVVPTLCTINAPRPPLSPEEEEKMKSGKGPGPQVPPNHGAGLGGSAEQNAGNRFSPQAQIPMGQISGPMPPMPMIDTQEQEDICVDNVARFFKAGGMVAVGTDTMRMESQPHVATMPISELKLLYKAGLSVADVIDAATINAARVCGIADEVGSIEVGKKANIIAVKDAIDETFDALSHVEFVMNRGVVIKE